LKKKFENWHAEPLEEVTGVWLKFRKILILEAPEFSNLKSCTEISICRLDVITCFKGWRHWKGYPVRGQGTWCNSWGTHKNNTFLRNFKIHFARKYYGNLNEYDLKLVLAAEHNNLLWWRQWIGLCRYVKSKRKKKVKKHGEKKDLK